MSIYDSAINGVGTDFMDKKYGNVNRATANSMYKSYVGWFQKTYGNQNKPLSFKEWMNWAKNRGMLNATGTTSTRTATRTSTTTSPTPTLNPPPIVRNPIPVSSGQGGGQTSTSTTTTTSGGGGSGSGSGSGSGGGGGGPMPEQKPDENLKDLTKVNKTGRNIAIAIFVFSAIGLVMAFTGDKQQQPAIA